MSEMNNQKSVGKVLISVNLWYNYFVQDIRQSWATRRFFPLYPEQIHDLEKGGGLLFGESNVLWNSFQGNSYS